MKLKLFVTFFVAIFTVAIFYTSCKKSSSAPTKKIFKTTTLKANNGLDIRVSAIMDSPNLIQRKVEIIDHITGEIQIAYIAELQSDKPILAQLNQKLFSGVSTIRSSDGFALEIQNVTSNKITKTIKPGKIQIHVVADPCDIAVMHDCVASAINSMSFIQYAICLAEAPTCYLGLWVVCSFNCGTVKPT